MHKLNLFFMFTLLATASGAVAMDPAQDPFEAARKAARAGNFEGMDFNIRNEAGATILFREMTSFLKVALIERMIDAGFDVNAQDNEGYTCLMAAAWHGRPEVVKLLLAKGAAVNTRVKSRNGTTLLMPTALMMALNKRENDENIEIIRLLVDAGADIYTQKNDDGVWALQMAVAKNMYTAKDFEGVCVMQPALSKNKNEAFKYMIAVAIAQDEDFLTRFECKEAFFGAALSDNSEIIQTLLNLGMDPNIQDEEGWTALHAAAQQGSLNAMKTLLRAGGDLAWGHTKEGNVKPYDLAQHNNRQEMVTFLDELIEQTTNCTIELVRGDANEASQLIKTNPLLLNAPFTFNIDRVGRCTPLMRAVHRLDFGLCDTLLEMGALTHLKDAKGRTALDIARTYTYRGWIEELIKLYEGKNSLKGKILLQLWRLPNPQLQELLKDKTRGELDALNVPFIITQRVQLKEMPEVMLNEVVDSKGEAE